jgi:hypothetical protein
LPRELKVIAAEKANNWALANRSDGTSLSNLMTDAINFADDGDSWKDVRESFLMHTKSIDRIRDESFWKTFPELNKLSEILE